MEKPNNNSKKKTKTIYARHIRGWELKNIECSWEIHVCILKTNHSFIAVYHIPICIFYIKRDFCFVSVWKGKYC